MFIDTVSQCRACVRRKEGREGTRKSIIFLKVEKKKITVWGLNSLYFDSSPGQICPHGPSGDLGSDPQAYWLRTPSLSSHQSLSSFTKRFLEQPRRRILGALHPLGIRVPRLGKQRLMTPVILRSSAPSELHIQLLTAENHRPRAVLAEWGISVPVTLGGFCDSTESK